MEQVFPTWSDSLEECPGGQLAGAVDGLPVVVGAPAGRVDVDVLVVVPQRPVKEDEKIRTNKG